MDARSRALQNSFRLQAIQLTTVLLLLAAFFLSPAVTNTSSPALSRDTRILHSPNDNAHWMFERSRIDDVIIPQFETSNKLPTNNTVRVCPQMPSRPFLIIWNHPDKCEGRWPMNFKKYGITANSKREFFGDQIKIYYNKDFKWPELKGHETINGGIPQKMNMEHFTAAWNLFNQTRSDNFTGLGVLDFESWRPVFSTNFGVLRPYMQNSLEIVRRNHPEYNSEMANKEATEQFDAAARVMFQKTMAIAQELMPAAKWGYYGFPRTWGPEMNTIKINNQLDWLWKQSTGLFPSIYLYSPSTSQAAIEERMIATIKETFRVKEAFSSPDTPIYPYSLNQFNAFHFYEEDVLEYAIGLPAKMGVDGVVLWGSSGYYREKHQCMRLQAWVQAKLGPYAKTLTSFLSDCSYTLCGGHGRCVRKDLSVRLHPSSSDVIGKCIKPGSIFSDYYCRCYYSWTGSCCQENLCLANIDTNSDRIPT